MYIITNYSLQCPGTQVGYEIFQVGIDQTDRDTETTGQFTLGKRLFATDLREKLEGTGGIKLFFNHIVHILNNSDLAQKNQAVCS